MSEYSRVQCWPVLKILCVLLCCSAQYRGSFAVDCQCSVGTQIGILNKTSGTCGCFDCPDCPEGMGSTVECGTTVPVGTNIECVHCADRFNYSDTHGRGQCRSCSVCSNHEHIERHCDSRNDIKCGDCKSGFVREPVVKDCVPTTTPSVSTVNQTQTPSATVVSHTKATTKKRTSSIDLQSTGSTTSSIRPTKEENSSEDKETEHDNTGNHTTKVDEVFIVTVVMCIGVAVPICFVFCRRYPLFNCSRRQSGNYSVRYINGQDRVQTFSEDTETGGLLQEGTSSEHTRFEQSDETALEVSLKNPFGLLPKGNPIPRFNAAKGNGKFVSLSPDNTQGMATKQPPRLPPPLSPLLLPIPSKTQSTTTTELLPSSTELRVSDDYRQQLMNKKVTDIPWKFYGKICHSLTTRREELFDDYRLFGEKIGLTKEETESLGQKKNVGNIMLKRFHSLKDNNIGKLKSILEDMERCDISSIIEEWVQESFQEFMVSSQCQPKISVTV